MAHICDSHIAWTIDNPLRRLIHPPEKILSDFVKKGMVVYDVGSGSGHFTREWQRWEL